MNLFFGIKSKLYLPDVLLLFMANTVFGVSTKLGAISRKKRVNIKNEKGDK